MFSGPARPICPRLPGRRRTLPTGAPPPQHGSVAIEPVQDADFRRRSERGDRSTAGCRAGRRRPRGHRDDPPGRARGGDRGRRRSGRRLRLLRRRDALAEPSRARGRRSSSTSSPRCRRSSTCARRASTTPTTGSAARAPATWSRPRRPPAHAAWSRRASLRLRAGRRPGEAEADPVMEGVPGEFGGAMDATMDLERQVLEAEGLEGLVLRYGFFYGPGSSYAADGHQAAEVRRRRFPIVGAGTGVFSFVHVDDAAERDRRRLRARRAGRLQRLRRRAGARPRLAAGLRAGRGGEAAAAGPEADREDRRRRGRRRLRDHAARRLEREGQARARVAAAVWVLARRGSSRRSDKF